MVRQRLHLMILVALTTTGCAGARLSSGEARKQIAAIGTSTLVPSSIEVRRIVSQSDTQAIAETTVALAFQFKKDKSEQPWKVAAVRLGDRDWISLDELLAALNEGRRRDTTAAMEKLVAGIDSYRQRNGASPVASDVVKLTDQLHPNYMQDLVRTDGWGHPIQYETGSGGFRLRSFGPDGISGNADDILLPK